MAPDFTLPDQHGNPFHLFTALKEGHAGAIIFFFPKADTPGCTAQACSLRDVAGSVGTTAIVGISPDPPKRLAAFDHKYSLGFPLLSDLDHSVAEAYGVWVEKNRYGRTYMGNERTTFVIGEDGTLRDVFRSVKPAEHDELVLGALAGP
jgi:thioredoxin-dependent peroxiredoxin